MSVFALSFPNCAICHHPVEHLYCATAPNRLELIITAECHGETDGCRISLNRMFDPADITSIEAFATADAIAQPAKNHAAVELGRRGGKKGAATRATRMTPEERSLSAKTAAAARWAKPRAVTR